ncbi:prion-like-(Q/N-rich) domain-bearing protein 25 isoform X2 [Microplitis demolitor]|uniref:prion-like-(Q/N-rich) domain-bearing protein 25 isoform X2 n=1 Tax=Microplitis demolitor TaxID=69319 RepID=UPI0006D50259|nr:prion-like-(Q/N-rich) domain-bearing protein 25 isoform X2 [Microplitis demolitor]
MIINRMNANIIIPIFFGIFTFSFADDFYEEPEFLGITECVDHGFFCNPHLEKSCCTKNTKCEMLKWPDQYYCVGNASLQMPCEYTADCNDINAVCSENQCVCGENYAPINDTACGPLIGGYCRSDDDCVPDNSFCINKMCRCKFGFTLLSNRECIRSYLGKSCDSDQDCYDINRAMCDENKKCVCRMNSIAIGENEICTSLIEGFCNSDSDCLPLNSVCVDNKCQCKHIFSAVSNRECKLSYIGQRCDRDIDCGDMNHAICSRDTKCICRENHISLDNATCSPLLGGYCWTEEECVPDNSICLFDKCQCKPHFEVKSNDQCVRKILGQYCKNNEVCEKIQHAKCSEDHRCICKQNHFAINDTICGSLLNGFCMGSEECSVDNSICAEEKCQCKVGFVQESKFKCIPAVLNKKCETEADCKDIWRSECSKDKVCICKANHTVVNGLRCAPLIGEFCIDAEDCAPYNSVCFKSKCECQSGFVTQFNTECVPPQLGKYCEMDIDCSGIRHSKCSSSNICICREHNIAVNNTSCQPILGSFCWKNEKCAPDNSNCVNNECQCKPSFTPESSTDCVKLPLGKSCYQDGDCSVLSHLKCSENNKCVCKSGYVEINQSECKPLLNGMCFSDKDCVPSNSECVENKCRCKTDFLSVLNDQCIPVEPPKPCLINRDCKDIRHARCNKHRVCECAIHYEEKNRTCMPLLGQLCIKDDICFPDHSDCVDNLCECKQDFKAKSNDLCLPV